MPPRPMLPRNPAGGPAGPGGSPALAPGDGSGNQAAAAAKIKAILPALHDALNVYQVGDKQYQAVLNAIRALAPLFGKESNDNMVPSAMKSMMAASQPKGPMAQMGPPPGLSPGGPSPMNLGGGG